MIKINNELQIEGQKLPNLTHPETPFGSEINAIAKKIVISGIFLMLYSYL